MDDLNAQLAGCPLVAILRGITPADAESVGDALVAAGFTIEKKRIHLHTPVKTLGKHEVKVKLHPEVTAVLSFDVVSENPIEPSAEEKAVEEKKSRKVEPRR